MLLKIWMNGSMFLKCFFSKSLPVNSQRSECLQFLVNKKGDFVISILWIKFEVIWKEHFLQYISKSPYIWTYISTLLLTNLSLNEIIQQKYCIVDWQTISPLQSHRGKRSFSRNNHLPKTLRNQSLGCTEIHFCFLNLRQIDVGEHFSVANAGAFFISWGFIPWINYGTIRHHPLEITSTTALDVAGFGFLLVTSGRSCPNEGIPGKQVYDGKLAVYAHLSVFLDNSLAYQCLW